LTVVEQGDNQIFPENYRLVSLVFFEPRSEAAFFCAGGFDFPVDGLDIFLNPVLDGLSGFVFSGSFFGVYFGSGNADV
jgi:hypothetical protein